MRTGSVHPGGQGLGPREGGVACLGCELEDGESVVILAADPEQPHNVGVPQRIEQVHLDCKLLITLHPPSVQLLHCNVDAVSQLTLVHL